MSNQRGTLYVVATPIGNLEDLTTRARRLLTEVDVIAAEDTRHTGKLLHHAGILTPVTAFHEHNEREKTPELIEQLRRNQQVALVSDAGTPLISDPGYRLVHAAHAAGITVVPIPGACAAIAALSAAGLPSDRFAFEGFPPAKSVARRSWLARLTHEPRTLIFYESPHRIVESLTDMAELFGPEREAVLARELTKQFETIRVAPLAELARWVEEDPKQQLGEMVVLVHGVPETQDPGAEAEGERVLRLLLAELPVRQAAALAAGITGRRKNELYDLALRLKNIRPPGE